uniref:Trehalase n=1 Tax=Piliocolobus tephrosceles TaxID=591936 RepID=A0A8C9HAG3_9PRIM
MTKSQSSATQVCRLPFDLVRAQKQESSWQMHGFPLSGIWYNHAKTQSYSLCHGELLHQVQMAKLYQDDKQFVDMPLSIAPEQVLQIFTELARDHNHSITREQLQAFVQEHFQAKGQELQPWTPADWKDSPQFLQKISDAKLRVWAGQLHQLRKKLGKKGLLLGHGGSAPLGDG